MIATRQGVFGEIVIDVDALVADTQAENIFPGKFG
jgi:hypothetical protein